MTLVDLSWALYPGISKIPQVADVEFRPVQEIAKGDSSNITQVTMASHIGTHIDAPVHFIPGAKTIDQMPLEQFTGPAVTVSVERGASEGITLQDISRADIQAGDIVFFADTGGHGITHNGIALGDGRFVHAASEGSGTIISSLSNLYWAKHFAGARRP